MVSAPSALAPEPAVPEPDASRSSYRHGDVRGAAIAAGLALLDEPGTTLTLREVARRIGVAHHALAHHFRDKAGFERALAARGFDALADQVEATDGPAAFVAAYARFALDRPRLYAVLMSQPYDDIDGDEELRTPASRVIAIALRAFAPDAPDAETGRRIVMRAWMLTHGGLALHGTGVLRLRDDEAFIAELLRVAGLAPDAPEPPQALWADHREETRP